MRGSRRLLVAVGTSIGLALVAPAPAGAVSTAPPVDRVDCEADIPDQVTVVVRPVAPYVFDEGDDPTGFSVELWQLIASRLGTETDFAVVPTVQDLLDTVRDGGADAGIAAVSITDDRETEVDFSVPMETTGLRLLVRPEHRGGLGALWDAFTSSQAIDVLLLLFALVLVSGLTIWIVERRSNPDFPQESRGLLDGLWWAIVTMATVGYGDHVPRTRTGRLLSVAWILIGVVLIAQFTAAMTSNLTVERLNSDVTSLRQLAGQDVVTVEGTNAADVLASEGVIARTVPDLDELVEAVASGEADAAVYDGSILEYRARQDDRVQVVGEPLTLDLYGIVLPEDDPLLECVDRALIDVITDGTWSRLHESWFG